MPDTSDVTRYGSTVTCSSCTNTRAGHSSTAARSPKNKPTAIPAASPSVMRCDRLTPRRPRGGGWCALSTRSSAEGGNAGRRSARGSVISFAGTVLYMICAKVRNGSLFALWDRPLFGRGVKRGVRRRHAGVDGGLQQRLLEVAPFEILRQPGSRVQAELFPSPHCGSDGEHQQPARADVETGTRPDGAPGKARDQILKRRARPRGGGAIDMRIAKDAAPDAHARVARVAGCCGREQELQHRRGERPRPFDIREMRRVEMD